MTDIRSCLCALALELTPGTRAARAVLDQPTAGQLAALIARDLAKFEPAAALLDLAVNPQLTALWHAILLLPAWLLLAWAWPRLARRRA